MTNRAGLAALEELVRLAERRVRRASMKRAAAIDEETEAVRALNDARIARADWIANCPDEQLIML